MKKSKYNLETVQKYSFWQSLSNDTILTKNQSGKLQKVESSWILS